MKVQWRTWCEVRAIGCLMAMLGITSASVADNTFVSVSELQKAIQDQAADRTHDVDLSDKASLSAKETELLTMVGAALDASRDGAALEQSAGPLNDASVDPEINPSHLAMKKEIVEYIQRFPDSLLASRINTVLRLRDLNQDPDFNVKRISAKVEKSEKDADYYEVVGTGIPGVLSASASVVIARKDEDGVVMYSILDYGGSRGYSLMVRPAKRPRVGEYADLYIKPSYVNLNGVMMPDPQVLGIWYAVSSSAEHSGK